MTAPEEQQANAWRDVFRALNRFYPNYMQAHMGQGLTGSERAVKAIEEMARLAFNVPTGEGAQVLAGFVTFRDGRFGSWLHTTRHSAEVFDSTAIAGGPANSEILAVFTAPTVQAVDLSKLTRYELDAGGCSCCGPSLDRTVDASGEWVRFDDVVALVGGAP